MTTATYLSSKDDATVKAELVTPSFLAMVQANTGLAVSDQNFALQTKEELMKGIQQGKLTGNLQFGGNSFDHLVFEFQPHENAQAISKEIVEFYANPDYMVIKNQGGGRVQNKPVNGTREVLYDLHIKQDGTAHLHILKSHWSVNGNKINPATTCKDTYVIKAEEYNLNQFLEKKLGLSNCVSSFVSGASPNSSFTQPKASPQTKSIVNQAVQQANTVEEYNEIVSQTQNVSVAPNLLANTLTSLDKELAELEEKKNILFETRKTVEATLIVEQNNKILENNNKILTEEVEKVKQEKEELTEKHNQELQEKQNEIFNLSEQHKETLEKLNGLEDDYKNLEEINSINEEQNKKLTNSLEIAEKNADYLRTELNSTKEENNLYKKIVSDQSDQIAEIKKAMEEQQKAIIELQAEKVKQNAVIHEQAEKQIQLEQDNHALKASIEPISIKVVELTAENETIKAQNTTLLDANEKLSNSVKAFTEFVDKLKTGYDKFTKAVKEKIKGMPELKKEIEPLIKEHTEINKEVKPLIQETKTNLTEAQKKMMEIMQKKAGQSSSNEVAEKQTDEPTDKNKFKPK